MDLLLLADPSINQIEKYLSNGECFVLKENDETIAAIVLRRTGESILEIMNLAVKLEWRGRGIGQNLIRAAIEISHDSGMAVLQVGTGNSSLGPLAFYQKCGFRIARIEPNYFVENYDHPIWENSIQCTDKIILTQYVKK